MQLAYKVYFRGNKRLKTNFNDIFKIQIIEGKIK